MEEKKSHLTDQPVPTEEEVKIQIIGGKGRTIGKGIMLGRPLRACTQIYLHE